MEENNDRQTIEDVIQTQQDMVLDLDLTPPVEGSFLGEPSDAILQQKSQNPPTLLKQKI